MELKMTAKYYLKKKMFLCHDSNYTNEEEFDVVKWSDIEKAFGGI